MKQVLESEVTVHLEVPSEGFICYYRFSWGYLRLLPAVFSKQ